MTAVATNTTDRLREVTLSDQNGVRSESASPIRIERTEQVRLQKDRLSGTDTAESVVPSLESHGMPSAATRLGSGVAANRILRRLLLASSGQIGASLASALILWMSLDLSEVSGGWLWQSVAALLLVRIWYFHTRGPKPVLGRYKIRKRAWRTIVDEGKIGIIFLGVCFVMAWPITTGAAALYVGGNFALQLCLMSFARLVIKSLADHDRLVGSAEIMTQRAIIVGTGENARKVADMILSSPELDTRLIGFLDFNRQGYWRYRDIPLIGHPGTLAHIAANTQVDALFWAVEPDDVPQSWQMMETAEKMGIRIFVMPSLYTPRVARVQPTYINGLPAMVYRSEPESYVPLLIKAVLDRIGALIGILGSAPVMLLAALAIKLDSRGPVMFKQTRLGLNGKPFTMLKFRTMENDAEVKKRGLMDKNEMTGPVFKIKEDPRVTRVGRFLRKFSIDEFPQFFNVLRGDMSLVGPRPPLPAEARRFEPWQHRKLSVRPGLTCLWQVNGRNSIDFEEWMLLDLHYIDNWSLWLDAKILAKTVSTVVRGTGQ
ncbi:MAG: sugar transferase [Candidatus Zixiibacteriota bacterium]